MGPAAVLGGRLLRRGDVGAGGDGNGPGTSGDDRKVPYVTIISYDSVVPLFV